MQSLSVEEEKKNKKLKKKKAKKRKKSNTVYKNILKYFSKTDLKIKLTV